MEHGHHTVHPGSRSLATGIKMVLRYWINLFLELFGEHDMDARASLGTTL
jgi:hypothetical protein